MNVPFIRLSWLSFALFSQTMDLMNDHLAIMENRPPSMFFFWGGLGGVCFHKIPDGGRKMQSVENAIG